MSCQEPSNLQCNILVRLMAPSAAGSLAGHPFTSQSQGHGNCKHIKIPLQHCRRTQNTSVGSSLRGGGCFLFVSCYSYNTYM